MKEIELIQQWPFQVKSETQSICLEEQKLVDEIKSKVALLNLNNLTRTKAYLEFYRRHPEVHWALLAHVVSRNGGWNMTDLKGSLLKHVFASHPRKDFFMFLEKANAFIFHDAYSQLLLYEKSKEEKKNYMHLLPQFCVSAFMEPVWQSFLRHANSKLLTVALIINEQHYIELRLISSPYYRKHVYASAVFKLQEAFHLNHVIFPYKEGESVKVIGLNVSHFAPLEQRIELGKKLYGMLFTSPYQLKAVLSFAASKPHTGSRADYWPELFSPQMDENIWSPDLNTAWENCRHTYTNEEWYRPGGGFLYFSEVELPAKFDITQQYANTLALVRTGAFLLNKFKISGHTNESKGVKYMGQNHQFKPGQKAPNNGYYVEIGETGSTVNDPNQIKLKAGEKFPDTKNEDRVWMPKRKP
ncbi:YjzC family protein [Jeotgalibacillus sp. ET6]|uniref:YjzC family protein n=1 Tax=Jeotgalibacillus sp. ET6 TaxID=3037260 RepID=UPI0024185AB6|nr:YjzC family protein [Jeotgalibacillus sp. ET6]MDG5473249.1 YjzC family protein [Jeotgalibacillus sp. ET6]